MKKIEFSVFTNLSKDELAMQKSLEAEQQRFGKILSADVSDSSYSRSLEQDKYSALEQLKVAEDLELAEFRMKTFSKPFVRPDATTVPPSSSSAIQSDQSIIINNVSKSNMNPVINIKLKKRKIDSNSSSSSSGTSNNKKIDSVTNAKIHDVNNKNHIQKIHKHDVDSLLKDLTTKPSTTVKTSPKLSVTTLPTLATPATAPPSALPLYYSDDDDDNDGD